jgi:hypothetical protein
MNSDNQFTVDELKTIEAALIIASNSLYGEEDFHLIDVFNVKSLIHHILRL